MSRTAVLSFLGLCVACTSVSQIGELSNPSVAGDAGARMDAVAQQSGDAAPADAAVEPGRPLLFPGVFSGQLASRALAAGDGVSCAIGEGYALYCWGRNDAGQLGVGDTLVHDGPQDTGLRGVLDVSTRQQNTCAVLSSGEAYCWGSNAEGQLGVDAGRTVLRPRRMALESAAQSVSVGGAPGRVAVVFLLRSGRAFGRGDNSVYLARGGSGPYADVPARVDSFDQSWSYAAVGARRACMISAGRLSCWGADFSGDFAPFGMQFVPGPESVWRVAMSESHGCVLTSTGRVRCMGANGQGQLGVETNVGSAPNFLSEPVALEEARDVAVGPSRTCVVSGRPSTVSCFGAGGAALGAGNPGGRSPVVVPGVPEGADLVAVGASHACAMSSSWGVRCWGDNAYGELGRATVGSSTAPLAVLR